MTVLFVQACQACAEEREPESDKSSSVQGSVVSALSHYRLDQSPKESEKLPKILGEISGLAVTADGRVMAHDDERGVVHELDADRGKIIKSFRLGKKRAAADFEGICITPSALFLVTSAGLLFETTEGKNDEAVVYQIIDTGIGDVCEVEGLAFDSVEQMLLLACKTTRGEKFTGLVTVFRWSIESRRIAVPATISISKDQIRALIPVDDFHSSGIAIHPDTGTLFLVAAREHALIEVTRDGVLLGAAMLKRKWHSRPEGIEFAPAKAGRRHDLLISDEGEDHRARLTRYRMRKTGGADRTPE